MTKLALLKQCAQRQGTNSLDQQLKQLGLSRDPEAGVGKRMGNCLYVHRSAEDVLPQDELKQAKAQLPSKFDYEIVKYDRNINAFSFIQSPDWDKDPEPTVGDSFSVKRDGTTQFRNASKKTQIYHHKWQFVRDSYPGFNVAASKRRSLQWRGLPNIDSNRIGYKDYWDANVEPRIGK